MYVLVLVRHGESEWNKENRFTGWTDVDLTDKGVSEAKESGKVLKNAGFQFDIAYTSVLKRSIRTLNFILDELDMQWIPVQKKWRLNERHYGALQGLNKEETAKKYGEEQVHLWRRSYDIRPPELALDDPRFPGNDRRYAGLDPSELPRAESLKDTIVRFMPLWHNEISRDVQKGARVIIVAHGNSLRALVKYLDHISDEDIADLNIPTGIPLVYELDDALRPVRRYYLGDEAAVKAAAEAVANQGKAK